MSTDALGTANQQEQPEEPPWVPSDDNFGARLALVRQRMRWGNVKEAALACGLPVESWRTWERDGVQPRRVVEIAAIISRRTGCDYGWLLTGARLRGGPGKLLSSSRVPTSYRPVASRPTGGRPPGHARQPASPRRPNIVAGQAA